MFFTNVTATDLHINLDQSLYEVKFDNVDLKKYASLYITIPLASRFNLKDVAADDIFILSGSSADVEHLSTQKPFQITGLGNGGAYIRNTTSNSDFSYSGNNIDLIDVDIISDFFSSNMCPNKGMRFLKVILGEGNDIKNAVEVSSTTSSKITLLGNSINGNGCTTDNPSHLTGSIIISNSINLENLTATGLANLHGTIHPGVTFHNPGGFMNTLRTIIQSGTTLIPHVMATDCNLSGTVGPNYTDDCDDKSEIRFQ